MQNVATRVSELIPTGTPKEEEATHGCPGPTPPRYCTAPSTLAKLPLPGQLHAVASTVGEYRRPDWKRKIPFSCQPPAIIDGTPPFERNVCPLPNGSS